jgi:general nucleoside transport system ATP-binding protein
MSEFAGSPDVLLRVESLTKQFPQVLANDSVSFEVRRAEIHCLLGENGAGKSTLAECLYGFYRPDAGQVFFKGQAVAISSPVDAKHLGIGMVHQHFTLVRPFTVVENVVVGTADARPLLDLSGPEKKLKELCRTYGVELDLNARVQYLSVGEQQWVEILKALYAGVELLILDEPTAVLTPQETERLLDALDKMRDDGISIILITHKLWEVMRIADRITILRKGKKVSTVDKTAVDEAALARMMVGRDVPSCVDKPPMVPGEPLLVVENLRAMTDRGQPALQDVSLAVHRNEILAIAGVTGNGQRELFETIIGVRKAAGGKVTFCEQDITSLSPNEIMRRGVLHVPGDRITEGLATEFSIWENLILGWQRSSRFVKGFFLDRRSIEHFAEECVANYSVATPSFKVQARVLSGGNLQKLILAREFSQNPACLIVSQPTRGLDVGAIEYVHCRLVEKREEGVGIILISEDLDEVFALADRIAVIFRGQIMSILDATRTTREQVGLLMAGIREGVQ